MLSSMKLMLAFLLLLLSSEVSKGGTITNLLAIYLLTEGQPPFGVPLNETKLDDIKLRPTPVLSDSDFTRYEIHMQEDHHFTITSEAAKRLVTELNKSMRFPKGRTGITTLRSGEKVYLLSWSDTPFVVFASGQAVYAGFFSTATSSSTCFDMPRIQPEQGFIGLDHTNDVRFRITSTQWQTNQTTLTTNSFPADVRNDPRILSAVEKLAR